MNKKEFGLFAMALKTYYPKENIIPSEQAAELWLRQLADISISDAEIFLNKWVSTQKWSPSIAEIRTGVAELIHGELPDWGKGWEQVEKAIRYFGYPRPDEAMASMDELTREVVKRLGGFMNLCQSEHLQNDRANFRMIYEQLAERKAQEMVLSPNLRNAIESRKQAFAIEDKNN